MLLMVSENTAADVQDRTIQGNVVVSTHDPAVQVRVPASTAYVGADRWLLKEHADDIELHCFVNADRDRRVRQIYWVQFEAYLSSRPELQHHYTSRRHATLGGWDFYLDTWVASADSPEGPDSDGAHLNTLLHSAGYRLPASMMTVRLVHLMADSRKELMLIYSEDLAATGFTAADFGKVGKAHAQWPAIEARLIDRAERIRLTTCAARSR
jgi:hypothetical protein